eukprot:1372477-Amorphochlora_amoeboformis.AAC.1
MGISIGVMNDTKTPVRVEFRLRGGLQLGFSRDLAPGDTWRKTDRVGLSASCTYIVVVSDVHAVVGPEECQWSLVVRAPSSAGVKEVKVSEIMSKGKKGITNAKISKSTYISTLWEYLDIDSNGRSVRARVVSGSRKISTPIYCCMYVVQASKEWVLRELSPQELADWVDNERFVRNKAFSNPNSENLVWDMLGSMDKNKNK